MLFNSYPFIFLFLPIILIMYFFMARNHKESSIWFLGIASLLFYAYWDAKYTLLLIGSIVFNYYMGSYLSKKPKKSLLFVGIGANLLLLGYYKYFVFILKTINGFNFNLQLPDIILPLGISFFTFTQIAFLVDAYRKETDQYTKADYFLFVTFFPHLIAGPILYHKDIIPQFREEKNRFFNCENFAKGICFFILGLIKKVFIADFFAPWSQAVFNSALPLSSIEAWCGALAYTLQLYFDFSAYSEMAIGLGLMLNIKLPINFDSPHKSLSIIEFWRRWHITLSHFLKSYLYIPLGGNRKGTYRVYCNLLITMLVGGIWHGAAWTFVIWGLLHGLYLVINHCWRRYGFALPDMLSWLITFISVVNALVVFRAETFTQAMKFIEAMYGFGEVSIAGLTFEQIESLPTLVHSYELIILIVACILLRYVPSVNEIMQYKTDADRSAQRAVRYSVNFTWKEAVLFGLGIFMVLKAMMGEASNEFLYFNF